MTPLRTAIFFATAAALPYLTGCSLGIDPQSLGEIYSTHALTGSASTGSPSGSFSGSEKPKPMPEQKPLHPPQGDGAHDGGHDAYPLPVGDSCGGANPAPWHSRTLNRRDACVALRYYVYRDASGNEVENHDEAARELENVNRIWSDCGIRFQVEAFESVAPKDFQLQYRTADYDELSEIRRAFAGDSSFLVVKTGPWNRRGSLGNSGANAWTALPGDGLYGAILEKPVASDANMLAHELGHYMSLDHVRDRGDLMSPVIYDDSLRLNREQCEEARWALRFYWSKAMR